MTKILKRVFAVLLSVICLIGFLPIEDAKAASSVAISDFEKTLYAGQSFTLTLENATGDIKWKSSNTKVATVNDGLVTGVKSGTTTITATYDNKDYKCYVNVKAARINCKQATMYEDGTLSLKVYGKTVKKYSSSDKKIAKVSKKGTVTAISKGKATITATCTDGTKFYCDVTVKTAYDSAVALSEMEIFTQRGTIKYNSGYKQDVDYSKDNLGNIHRDYLCVVDGFDVPFVTYKVNREYSNLSGVLYTPYAFRSDDTGLEVRIYGDKEVIWSAYTERGADPIEFNIDISEIDEIGIYWMGYAGTSKDYKRVTLGDLYLIP